MIRPISDSTDYIKELYKVISPPNLFTQNQSPIFQITLDDPNKKYGFDFYLNDQIALHSGVDHYTSRSEVVSVIKCVQGLSQDLSNYQICATFSGTYRLSLVDPKTKKTMAVKGGFASEDEARKHQYSLRACILNALIEKSFKKRFLENK